MKRFSTSSEKIAISGREMKILKYIFHVGYVWVWRMIRSQDQLIIRFHKTIALHSVQGDIQYWNNKNIDQMNMNNEND